VEQKLEKKGKLDQGLPYSVKEDKEENISMSQLKGNLFQPWTT